MLDTIHRIETPEGVDLDLHVAGPLVRLIAWGIDFLIRILAGLVISIPLAILGNFGGGLLLIVMFLLEWFYPVFFEVIWDGATPGKRAMQLHVVHQDGTPVGWVSSVLRNLLRAADFLPVLYVFGLVTILFSPSFQRLGDLAGGTLVVYRARTRDRSPVPLIPPHPAPVSLTLAEMRTIISFGQRAAQLPQGRAHELAAVAGPLFSTDPTRVHDPVRYLCGIAAWLIGRRDPGQVP